MDRVAGFAILLFIIQSIEGTAFYFSVGCAAFLILVALAFNAGGGLTRAAGAYVFFYAILVVVIGLCYKALLGEPAESNLNDPRTTIAAYVATAASLLVTVVLSRLLSRKRGLLEDMLEKSEMYRSSVGCIVFGIGGATFISLFDTHGSTINKIFTQLNQLIPLGIIIGVIYEIRRSGGKRSINLPVGLAIMYYFVIYGLLAFSKQGMLTAVFCWAMPVCAMRYRLTALQVASCMLGVFIVFQYLVPYSQYGRRFLIDNPSTSERYTIAMRLLKHPSDTRRRFEETQEAGPGAGHYFNKSQGFWDRLNFIGVDDSLINVTDEGHVYGTSPILSTFVNAVPHFIFPDKPTRNYGNIYAHEVGGLPEDDTTTGVSFSPTSEAYHMDKWMGIFLIAPLIWFLLFFILDSLLGDLRATPWGLLALALLSHTAPEGGLTGAISLFTFGAEIFIFSAYFATWLAPTFAVAVLGRDRRSSRKEIVLWPGLTSRVPQ
jgi:hypothetical protein